MFCLFVVTLLVFLPVRGHGMIAYDDPHYVSDNAIVKAGLTRHGLTWSETTGHASNGHPPTWISHMLDVTVFGPDAAGAMHVVNVVLHAASAALLFAVLHAWTGALWRSALVAAVFALHPLRVESVAWIAERKDVLSTCLWMATMLAYIGYARRGGLLRYAAVGALLALGLLAKPMLVTLPAVLLVMDWVGVGKGPRGRGAEGPRAEGEEGPGAAGRLVATRNGARVGWLVVEKLPLFALAAISSVVTLRVQAAGRSVSSIEALSLGERLSTAVVACAAYIVRLFDPLPLSVLHPHPKLTGGAIATSTILLSAVLLLIVSAAVVFALRRAGGDRDRRVIVAGVAWFVISLLPVVGLVHIGQHLFADRYTYIPHAGLLIAVVWAGERLTRRLPGRAVAAGALGAVALGLCIWQTRVYLHAWRDGEALFQHAIDVTDDNWPMHLALAREHVADGRFAEAIESNRAAARLAPRRPEPWTQLGAALAGDGQLAEAGQAFAEALALDARRFDALLGMGNVLFVQQRDAQAAEFYQRAVEVRPGSAVAHYSLGNARVQLGDTAGALRAFDAAVALEPGNAELRAEIARILRATGHAREAARYDSSTADGT